MSNLPIFSHPSFGTVRIVERNDEPWFVAKDVAKALGYASTNMTTIFQAVPEEWKGSNPITTLGGEQEMLIISEQGLYFFLGRSDEDPWFVASDVAKALGYEKPNNAVNEHCKKMNKITLDPNLGGRVATVSTPPIQAIIIPESDVYRLVMRSNLPRAVEFQDWICEEVIPSIRKHGLYATEEVVDRILDDPDFGITLLQRYKFEREQRQLAEAQRDEAIRTKAQIGSRREATAMATASAAVRKAAALENELGRGRDYKSVKGIPWFLDVFADTPAAYSVAGRKLSELSRRLGYEIREVEDTRYGIVKAYHVDVIEAFRLSLKNDLNMMRKYRS